MALSCPACRSDLVQVLAQFEQCLACGVHYDPVTKQVVTTDDPPQVVTP